MLGAINICIRCIDNILLLSSRSLLENNLNESISLPSCSGMHYVDHKTSFYYNLNKQCQLCSRKENMINNLW